MRCVRLDLLEELSSGGDLIPIGADQEARSGGWCERHGDGQLWVIPAPHARVSLRPGEIKHELAVRV